MDLTIPHNFTPRDYQLPLYNCLSEGYRRAVSVWHRRSGKDKTMINIMAKESQKVVGAYYYFFPYAKQGRKVLWNGMDRSGFKFMNHFPQEIRERTLDQEMTIFLKNGSLFQVIGTDKVDAEMGTNCMGAVFSEYSLQRPEVWDKIRPILKENGGFAIFNFTPRGLNHGHRILQVARKSPRWFAEVLTVDDTKVLTPQDIQEERDDGMTEAMILQEYYCDFSASNPDVLIPLDLVLRGVDKALHPDNYRFAPKVMGVDVARFGDDSSVICKRQGLACFEFEKYEDIDNMRLASCVGVDIEEFRPDAVFIDAGRGEGVIDRLRQLGFPNIIEVNFGGKAINPKYKNKRVEMWAGIKDWLKAGGVVPNDPDLKTELSLPTYWFDAAERMVLQPKEKIKEDFGMSPDTADSLALTFAEHVMPLAEALRRSARQDTTAVGNYDLFDPEHKPAEHRQQTAISEYDVFGVG